MAFSKEQFKKMTEKVLLTISELAQKNKRIMATSSFQTQSVPLLHILSQSPIDIPIYFLNTG